MELRLQIYAHLASTLSLTLRRSKPQPTAPVTTSSRPQSSGRNLLSLLLTCRQIHAEALPVIHSHPKPLVFAIPHLDSLTPLPSPGLPPAFAPSITTVLFPSRSGSRLLLEQLPNLRAIGVCRNALTRSPDLVWEGRNGDTGGPTLGEKLAKMREWLVWLIGEKKFVWSLSQQWVVHYFYRGWYFPELEKERRRADVWCRVVGLMGKGVVREVVAGEETGVGWGMDLGEVDVGSGEWVVRQAVWVNLDDLSNPERWRWCVPTWHGVTESWWPGSYNPPLEREAGDEGLATICRWWGGGLEDEDGERKGQGVPLIWNGARFHS